MVNSKHSSFALMRWCSLETCHHSPVPELFNETVKLLILGNFEKEPKRHHPRLSVKHPIRCCLVNYLGLKMGLFVNKAGVRAGSGHIMILLLATIATVFGCGVMPAGQVKAKEMSCIIIGNTVTAICFNMHAAEMKLCTLLPQVRNPDVEITPVSGPPLKISGSLSTTNIIMANWSKVMWQSVMNRAIRVLASGPFGVHFFSAFAAVD
ncbi:hypothetical protein KIN20_012485 [Parelaphostrongylus tenuis]|uniref:Uncharacterized protein n=1 Tax=Parelaphostrongylus tenuis TaxID=148309 RepID=A0AAD5MC77_PARTN|nr:hypothetical protein KIN20_012485 [Parelaphostrongylus tenuis]